MSLSNQFYQTTNDDVEYKTTISIDDPTNIFERLIRRFHNPDVYQNK